MTTEPLYSGEAVCKRWGDSSSGGRTVTFQLEDGGDHPFRGYEGERFAVVIVPIGNDGQPMVKQVTPERGEAAGGKTAAEPDQLAVAAPLGSTPAAGNSKPKRRFHEMPPSQQAALLCTDPQFWAWLKACGFAADNEEEVTVTLRLMCNVGNRSELDVKSPGGGPHPSVKILDDIIGNFRAWQKAKSLGQA